MHGNADVQVACLAARHRHRSGAAKATSANQTVAGRVARSKFCFFHRELPITMAPPRMKRPASRNIAHRTVSSILSCVHAVDVRKDREKENRITKKYISKRRLCLQKGSKITEERCLELIELLHKGELEFQRASSAPWNCSDVVSSVVPERHEFLNRART